jgi:hypothetical protein
MVADSKLVAPAAKRRPPNAGKGRVKGSKNKTTVAVKEALTAAFEGIGGVKRLQTWAEENTTEFYKLWGRLIPTEVSGPDGGAIPVDATVDVSRLTAEQLHALASVKLRSDA